ncbi:unnamed protein product [Porites lobata]|uniref:Uncharacterized protein n=1 Tax=Porites lobata TaxID=104759 RepID=A0ABN8N474_9CNID|nr:unnamed protein product [Porites lobata]
MIGGGSLCVPEKQVRALKDVHCYDWKTLVEKGQLDTMKVPDRELDKYIEHNKLSKNGQKIDKIKRITVHYYETSKESTFPSSVSVAVHVHMVVTDRGEYKFNGILQGYEKR